MESLSKNKQTKANIRKIVEKVFAPFEMKSCQELTKQFEKLKL